MADHGNATRSMVGMEEAWADKEASFMFDVSIRISDQREKDGSLMIHIHHICD
jgi:hypothetical protein